jgi:hypothetical protein
MYQLFFGGVKGPASPQSFIGAGVHMSVNAARRSACATLLT